MQAAFYSLEGRLHILGGGNNPALMEEKIGDEYSGDHAGQIGQ